MIAEGKSSCLPKQHEILRQKDRIWTGLCKVLDVKTPKVQSRQGESLRSDTEVNGYPFTFFCFCIYPYPIDDPTVDQMRHKKPAVTMKCKLITNNILVSEGNKTDTHRIEEIVFLDTMDINDVFRCVRDYIHKGHKLLTHPLSGSIKPVETPFKSIAISSVATTMDVESLLIIEDAIIMAKNFTRERGYKQIPPEILEDFRLIDFGLIKSGLEGINNY